MNEGASDADAGVSPRRPRVVILGAGFGGLATAWTLRGKPVEVELIDRRNYHLFQPLLYQVATADLSPADIAWPIRGVFSGQPNISVTLSEVRDIDLSAKQAICTDRVIPYDYLIIATGAQIDHFGNDHWAEHAPGLKRIVDATDIRRRVLLAFERAELASDEAERIRQLTFVIVGGGPTGVEMAGAISELARYTLVQDFRRIRPADARVILLEGGDRVLSSFPDDLSEKARQSLEALGVEVRVSTLVQDIGADGVTTSDGFVPSATVVWGAGVKVRGVGNWLGVETDRGGRVQVDADLSVPGHPEVFVIGDAASVPWRDGANVPGIAPAAKQMGRFVGRRIARELDGHASDTPFRYRHYGNLATIGRNSAIIDFGRLRFSGFFAWWVWGIAHIAFLIGVRRPLFVALSWFWSYITYSKGARLITGIPTLESEPKQPRSADSSAETL